MYPIQSLPLSLPPEPPKIKKLLELKQKLHVSNKKRFNERLVYLVLGNSTSLSLQEFIFPTNLFQFGFSHSFTDFDVTFYAKKVSRSGLSLDFVLLPPKCYFRAP